MWRPWLVLLAACAVGLFACTQESYPLDLYEQQHPMHDASAAPDGGVGAINNAGDASVAADVTLPVRIACPQANAQPLPQRLVTMSSQAVAANLVYVADLDSQFEALCGACHGATSDPPGSGNFRIANAIDFQTNMTKAVLAHVTSDGPKNPSDPLNDPLDPMPPFSSPAGKPYSQRLPTDPVVQFATLVSEWIAAGSAASFTPPTPGAGDGGADAGAVSPYLMTTTAGNAMTNIGTCVPSGPVMMAAAQQSKAAMLDAMFAGLMQKQPGPGVTPADLIGLPEHLNQTDLFTLDSSILAPYGVVAFQPTYPLWSDDAGKIRYVRVPVGQSIQFDKVKQEFVIPDNTRFYKTFLRQIIDTDGSYRWRKIETRLIVARHDTQNPDGTPVQNALYGTYLWNANETDAVLNEQPLRDGIPFTDTVLVYNTDEQLAADLLSQHPADPQGTLIAGGAARHYAVPSSQRCVQCHMGSNAQAFVLGFRPVEMNRRPTGQGGTLIEVGQVPATADELTQMQRLIDYGVVTGMTSPLDVLPLEQSQGTRPPRNQYELTAQSYMLGNCVHCHNPRGFPSVTNPVLADTFNLLPGPTGGIFQFPLEQYSPRITRGNGGSVKIPYITPSLLDLSNTSKLDSSNGIRFVAYAPWRSLIYRNVDTPFTYTDDYGLFPHMPMNTPGYDCRVHQIMGDWMASIPAVRKNPQIPDFSAIATPLPDGGIDPSTAVAASTAVVTLPTDDSPQPYVEVLPGMPGYDAAYKAAQDRVKTFETGVNRSVVTASVYSRYEDCPDTRDILDPAVERDPSCHPIPSAPTRDYLSPYQRSVFQSDSSVVAFLTNMHVPAHAHWVRTDLSQIAGDYHPRRTVWPDYLVKQNFPPVGVSCAEQDLAQAQNDQDEVKLAVGIIPQEAENLNVSLQTATLEQVRKFVMSAFPMGLWQEKSGCNYGSLPTISSFSGSSHLQWMDNPAAKVTPTSHVYVESPGAAVFSLICVNCHGPSADAHGRLSDNLVQMTGGNADVANLRDGLFGPISNPGANRQGPFGVQSLPGDAAGDWRSIGVDDRAARYMAWMAGGGTEVNIPKPVLQIVGNTSVLGISRSIPPNSVSANMLSVAKDLCYSVLFGQLDDPVLAGSTASGQWYNPEKQGIYEQGNYPQLITANGDAELWLRLCSVANPPPVRAIHGDVDYRGKIAVHKDDRSQRFFSTDLFSPDIYGAHPVGDDQGNTDPGGIAPADPGMPPANLRPWCYRPSSNPGMEPACPSPIDDGNPSSTTTGANTSLATLDSNYEPTCAKANGGNGCWGPVEADQWATRGAINAAFAVFLYLDAVERDPTKRAPDYTQCPPSN
jgi:mono/diheme cytochrome c family protein